MAEQFRAVFEYPAPWDKAAPVHVGYGKPQSTRAEAKADRPLRPEETHGRNVGVQRREVTEWEDD